MEDIKFGKTDIRQRAKQKIDEKSIKNIYGTVSYS